MCRSAACSLNRLPQLGHGMRSSCGALGAMGRSRTSLCMELTQADNSWKGTPNTTKRGRDVHPRLHGMFIHAGCLHRLSKSITLRFPRVLLRGFPATRRLITATTVAAACINCIMKHTQCTRLGNTVWYQRQPWPLPSSPSPPQTSRLPFPPHARPVTTDHVSIYTQAIVSPLMSSPWNQMPCVSFGTLSCKCSAGASTSAA